ncbi:M15 family metallopeptidase [Pseudotabrizicola sp. L79]|uniref:M15 family metallopeptidase n=1 Tax=Pseudotabrizicola sp. L79 TaxID=3118402 RepID=UPI002F95DC52
MLISRLIGLSLVLGLLPVLPVSACTARDFLALSLPPLTRSPEAVALELGYPGVIVNDAAGTVVFPDGQSLPLGQKPDRPARARLEDASIAEQFVQIYPLPFDLTSRSDPWFDPGRARNDAFFRALYGNAEGAISKTLVRVDYPGAVKARFSMTTQHCAALQLQAALQAIAAQGATMDRYFTGIGGSFNWRKIAGTQRLSAHSFGIAVDFNTELGGYWRWSGATEGNAGGYDNQYPESLVREMERFGFVWGGKWHHFDGMHFEYRPELILYARMMGG